MTDFANLVLAVDSRQVKEGTTELDRLTAAGQRTEQAAKGFQGEWVKASSEAGRLRMGLLSTGEQMDRATASAGAHRAGLQQLGYQLGDAATMFAMGGNAAQIFASQLGQTIGAVQLMSGGTSRLAAFLGGPWGIAISTAAIALAPFIARLWDTKDGAEAATSALEELIDARRREALERTKTVRAQVDHNGLLEQEAKFERMVSGLKLKGADPRLISAREAELRAIRLKRVESEAAIRIEQRGEEERRRRDMTTPRVSGGSGGGGGRARAATAAGIGAGTDYSAAFLDSMDRILSENRAWDIHARLGGEGGEAAMRAMSAALEDGAALIQGGLARADEAFMRNVYEPAKAAAEETQRLNDNLADTVSLLMGLGRAGRGLGDVASVLQGLATGDTMNLPGKLGGIVGTLDRASEGGLARIFQRTMTSIFGSQGEFTKKMDTLFQGAGVGMAFGQTLFGGNKSASTGSTIGGAIGNFIPGLPPGVGSAIGSIIGGIIGGAFKKTKTGSATIGAGDFGFEVTGTAGNSGSRKRAASSAANDIIGSIESIADALGGSATGEASVSIGIRNKKYRVDTTGQGRTKGAGVLNFGKDQEGAMKAAIQDAIADGAITGLRATVQALLKGDADLERQLGKALKLNTAFDDLAERTDPIAFAMGKLTDEFEALRRIATEAGASAAEMAQLEELLALRREEAAENARQSVLDKIRDSQNLEIRLLELLGREEDALAASRLLELAGLKATLQPLQSMIYQLEDARQIIDKFGPLSEDLKAFRAELLGGQASGSFTFLATQFRRVAGLAANGDADAMGRLRGVAGDYLSAARDNAGSALDYQRAVGEVLASVDKSIFAADSQIEYAQAQIDAINNTAGIIERMRAEMATYQGQIVENTAFVARLWSRFEGDGLTVKTDSDTPLNVTVTA